MAHIFECLVKGSETVLRKIRKRGLAGGGVSLGVVTFKVSKAHAGPVFLSRPAPDVSSQLLLQLHDCLPVAMTPAMMIMDQPSEM